MGDSHQILIADDDAHARAALALRLEQVGFKVLAACDGRQAKELADSNQVDAAILDVKMPGIDGFGVCTYLRQTHGAIPIFLLTGASDGVVRNFLPELTTTVGADHYLTKPYDGKAVAQMVRAVLAPSCTSGA